MPTKGETVQQTVEQIEAAIERATSLAEAENVEALAELDTETEGLISSLPSRGKVGDKTAAQAKKDFRAAFKAAATVQEKPASKAVATKPEPAPVAQYTDYEGVPELVAMGAQKVTEGVRLHIKTSVTAKEVAAITLDMWRRIPDKDGNPDIKGTSDAAKKASGDMTKTIGEALGKEGLDAFDVKEALKKLSRSVQTQRTDVRAEYLRSLDGDTDEAAEEREHFADILDAKPDDVPASVWVANHYGVGLKGEIEKSRERYHAKLALGSADSVGDDDQGDDDDTVTDPDTEIRAVVRRLRADVERAKPETFEAASEATRVEVREELETLYKAVKDMITATYGS